MPRKTASPSYDAAYIGALDVSAADGDWAVVNSEDMEDAAQAAGTALPAGLKLVGLVVYADSGNGGETRIAFTDRSGDAGDKDNSIPVPAGGAYSESVRGLAGGQPDAFSYAASAAADVLRLVAYWDPA